MKPRNGAMSSAPPASSRIDETVPARSAAASPVWRAAFMKLPRRQFLHLAASAAALPGVSRIARAQAYPTRPVRIIVGFVAGGPNDIVARLIGQWLSERLGQQFIVENRAGADGNIATEPVVTPPPARHTLIPLTPTPPAH